VLDMPLHKKLRQGTIVTYAGDLNNAEKNRSSILIIQGK
jgi:hypothetical protein